MGYTNNHHRNSPIALPPDAPVEARLHDRAPLLIQEQFATPGSGKQRHTHPEAQLYIALRGVIVVDAADTRCIIPPGHWCWIPPGVEHGASVHGGAVRKKMPASSQPAASKDNDGNEQRGLMGGLTLYLAAALCRDLPAQTLILRQTPLLQALLQRMQAWPPHAALDAAQQRLLMVFIDELRQAPPEAM
ncbi:MAG: AraC family ligand binding domain-containing protein [Burkholderiales bacterium]|nr:AraC family ligand binding domain-containing protein [Burkholderiales bacterium]